MAENERTTETVDENAFVTRGDAAEALRDDPLGTQHDPDEAQVAIPGDAPPLPDEEPENAAGDPPLPDEAPDDAPDAAGDLLQETPDAPDAAPPLPDEEPEKDDGWEAVWEESAKAFYFYNRFTGKTQWTNPRVPETESYNPAIHGDYDPKASYAKPSEPTTPKYNPAIHGDYDPNASYAKDKQNEYITTGAFNRFTGRFQVAELNPAYFSDDSRTARQLHTFYDVEANAQAHDGRSLRAERSMRKLSKAEVQEFRAKRKAKKEERRRAWLRD